MVATDLNGPDGRASGVAARPSAAVPSKVRDAGPAVAAWVLGVSGSVAAFRGWGTLILSPSTIGAAERSVVVISGIWTLAFVVLRPRVVAVAVASVAAAAALALACAPNAGREAGLVAAASMGVSLAAWLRWPTVGRFQPTGVALVSLIPFVGAQVAWVRTGAPGPTAALLAVAAGLVLAAAVAGSPVAIADAWLRALPPAAARAARPAAGAIDRAAHRAAGHLGGALRRATRWRPERSSLVLVGVGLLIAAAWLPATAKLVREGDAFTVLGINDYPLHLQVAQRLTIWPLHIEGPHFLFHLVAAGFATVMSDDAAAVATIALATATAYLSLCWLLRWPRTDGLQLSRAVAGGTAALYFFCESPTLAMLAARLVSARTPFLTIHWWGNPTWMTSLPFTFAALPLIERVRLDAEEDDGTRPRGRWLLAAVVGIGALAKPGLGLCLIPGLPTYLLLVRRSPRRVVLALLRWAWLPAVLVVAWQSWYLRTSASSQFSTSWTFAPIVAPVFGWGPMGHWHFWIPALVLVIAVWASRGRFFHEPSVGLVMTCSAFGLAMMLTLRETGERATHGNNAVAFQTCLVLLIALAIRSCAWSTVEAWHAHRDDGERLPPWLLAAGVLAAALLCGGIVSYLAATGLLSAPVRWETG